MSKGIQIAIAVASVCVAGAVLVSMGGYDEGTFSYYANVEAYLASPAARGSSGRALRVHGFVTEGSIQKNLAENRVDFQIADHHSDQSLPVRYLGIDVPDLFRDGAEVVVEGRHTDDVFVAKRVLAKCPSKYEAESESEA